MSYASIESGLFIRSPADVRTQELQTRTGDPTLMFKGLLVDFLKGTGVPCPDLFSHAQDHFNNVDLDLINKDFYRPRMFCCATTGSYDLENEGMRLSVSPPRS